MLSWNLVFILSVGLSGAQRGQVVTNYLSLVYRQWIDFQTKAIHLRNSGTLRMENIPSIERPAIIGENIN